MSDETPDTEKLRLVPESEAPAATVEGADEEEAEGTDDEGSPEEPAAATTTPPPPPPIPLPESPSDESDELGVRMTWPPPERESDPVGDSNPEAPAATVEGADEEEAEGTDDEGSPEEPAAATTTPPPPPPIPLPGLGSRPLGSPPPPPLGMEGSLGTPPPSGPPQPEPIRHGFGRVFAGASGSSVAPPSQEGTQPSTATATSTPESPATDEDVRAGITNRTPRRETSSTGTDVVPVVRPAASQPPADEQRRSATRSIPVLPPPVERPAFVPPHTVPIVQPRRESDPNLTPAALRANAAEYHRQTRAATATLAGLLPSTPEALQGGNQ